MGRSGLNSQLILSTEQHLSTAGTNECTNKTERKKEKKQGKGVTVLLMFYAHENKNKDNKKSAII